MSRKNLSIYLSILFILLPSCLAAVMVPYSTARLTGDAQAIITGEVINLQCAWNRDKSMIYTRVDIHIRQTIKGNSGAALITVVYPGGEVGDTGMGASDQPSFSKGEEVLLFLEQPKILAGEFTDNTNNNVYEVVAAAQGKYSIGKDGIACKTGFTVASWPQEEKKSPAPGVRDSTPQTENIDNNIPLDLLLKKIRGEKVIEFFPTANTPTETQDLSRPFYSSHGKWGTNDVWLLVNTSGGPSYGFNAIIAGMEEWSNVQHSAFRWRYAGLTTAKAVSKNGKNSVYFTNLNNYLGYSNWWYTSGKIVETDIRLDTTPVSNYPWNFGRLKAVMLHELGHSLGLNHVSVTSIMKLPITDSLQTLAQDDKNAAIALYPGGKVVGRLKDLDDDGNDDALWHYESTGKMYVWLLDGITPWATLQSGGKEGSLIDAMTGYILQGSGDFNGDGKYDLLWQNGTSGQVYVWLLDGKTPYSTLQSGGKTAAIINSLSNWRFMGLGDFDGDGKDDILWQQDTTGQVYIWLLNGTDTWTTLDSGDREGVLVNSMTNWILRGIGDFDGDGKDDLLWQHATTGQVYVWLLNGITPYTDLLAGGKVGSLINSLSSTWAFKGIGDFNGDGKHDLLWQSTTNGQVVVWLLDGTTAYAALQSGGKAGAIINSLSLNWTLGAIDDFDGDGKTDLLWQYKTTGQVYVWLLDGISTWATLNAANKEGIIVNSLSGWDLIGTGDFNGDGKTDLLWKNSSTNEVYAWLMDGKTPLSTLQSSGKAGSIHSSMNKWKLEKNRFIRSN